jgi:hypothetical protein
MKHIRKHIIIFAAIALFACSTTTTTQTEAPPQDQPTSVAGVAREGEILRDLDAMTSSCPRAGLNAAAREAAKVPSQGRYQFSYFKLISSRHHSIYEVRFKSNYYGDPELKYCVSVYCQEGQDPNALATVSLVKEPRPGEAKGAPHTTDCGTMPMTMPFGSKDK